MDQASQDLKNWKPEELQWPTDDELLQLAREWNSGNESIDFDCIADYAREVLAIWGRPTPQPVAVSERLPGPEDCEV